MKDHRSDAAIEKIIRASVEITDVPDPELNSQLKAALYQREAVLQKQPATHALPLWYMPMICNLAAFSLLAVLALMIIENVYLSYFAAGICLYIGAAGILLTIVGVKRANIKEEITIRMKKRGVLS